MTLNNIATLQCSLARHTSNPQTAISDRQGGLNPLKLSEVRVGDELDTAT